MCKHCESREKIELENGVCESCRSEIDGNKLNVYISYEFATLIINYCPMCGKKIDKNNYKFSNERYEDALKMGLDLHQIDDYKEYFGLQ